MKAKRSYASGKGSTKRKVTGFKPVNIVMVSANRFYGYPINKQVPVTPAHYRRLKLGRKSLSRKNVEQPNRIANSVQTNN